MAKLTDAQIRAWIKNDEHFAGRSDGNGLTLCYHERFKFPAWYFRYSIGGKPRNMALGSYKKLSLKSARDLVKQLAAKVALGIDPQLEKADNLKQVEGRFMAEKRTVSSLCDDYLSTRKIKTVEIERRQIVKDLLPLIGRLPVTEVNAAHVQEILKRIKSRNAPTVANRVLRLATKIFNHGVKLQWLQFNVWAAFEISDAGGQQEARDRWLDEKELPKLFKAMNNAKGWSYENDSAVRLLLMLGVRKMELLAAPIQEFDLDGATWHLPAYRINKKGAVDIDIPLPAQAVERLRQLIWLGSGSDYLFPARKSQTRMLPHISHDTVNSALKRFIKTDIPHFTVHDMRRTARTHLERLGFSPRIGEKALNHKIKGTEGVYNRYAYFEERRHALQVWADYLESIGG